jgi:hypothetical protein
MNIDEFWNGEIRQCLENNCKSDGDGNGSRLVDVADLTIGTVNVLKSSFPFDVDFHDKVQRCNAHVNKRVKDFAYRTFR